jgi:hypothetical protein
MTTHFLNSNARGSIAQARALADDLAAVIERGAPPPAADLAQAPIIDLWRPAVCTQTGLLGVVAGHPRIIDGRSALTTSIFAIDVDAGWARTWSRFYRLGRSHGSNDGRPQ